MRFGLSGWNRANNLQHVRIDNSYSVIELGGHVEKAVRWPKNGAVRPNTVTQIQIANNLPRCNVDHDHVAAVRASLTDARIAVDWHIGELAIRRRSHFMASSALLGDRGNLPAGLSINDAERVIAFIGNKQN